MFGYNEDSATLFNISLDENRKPIYHRTYLTGIDWQQATGVKFLKTTGSSADIDNKILVFVNYGTYEGKTYIGPKEFSKLEDKSNYYTFNEGEDILLKGIHDIEITNSQEFNNIQKNHDDVVKIINVTKCELTKHFELGCE
nr:MAG TPA: hypothetical protein [Caudoviricetes sp.]